MMTSEEKAAKNRANVKEWKAANRDKVREQHKRYYLRHRERRLAYDREYKRMIREKAKKYDELTGGADE